jgi:hypothetical protein
MMVWFGMDSTYRACGTKSADGRDPHVSEQGPLECEESDEYLTILDHTLLGICEELSHGNPI